MFAQLSYIVWLLRIAYEFNEGKDPKEVELASLPSLHEREEERGKELRNYLLLHLGEDYPAVINNVCLLQREGLSFEDAVKTAEIKNPYLDQLLRNEKLYTILIKIGQNAYFEYAELIPVRDALCGMLFPDWVVVKEGDQNLILDENYFSE